MKRKGYVSVVLAIMLIFTVVLSACSKNEPSNSGTQDSGEVKQTGNTPNNSKTNDEPEVVPDEKKEPVTLKLLTWFVGQYQAEFDLFHKKYPWITIEPLVVGGDDAMMEKQAALVAAGDSADLTWIQGLSTWTNEGLLEDLTPYIEVDKTIQEAKVSEGFLDAFKTGEERFAIPFSKIAEWMLVNKDLLKKKGMEMPANDWTYEDLLEMAKKATDPAAGEYGIAYDALFSQHFKWAMPVANGHADNLYFLNKDLTQSVAHTPDVLNDMRWIMELTTKWNVIPDADEAAKMGWDLNNSFLTGKALFTLGADWVLPGLKTEAKFEWDVLPMPKGKVMQATTQILGPIGILKASKHKEEAFKWLSFQFELEAQKWMIENGSNTFVEHPDLDSYIDQVEMWKGKNTEAVKLSTKMCCNMPGANVPDFTEYLATVDNALTDMFRTAKGDVNSIIPAVEAWNKKTLESRKLLGW
ncbi:extracellular solute-binding protein [Paenibacillus mendelii]|uniref:Extracellular solute-binding protein n=1 Tax=Paenibacillus mendelii TaxID=206163 RepID=A0ABV6JNZ0_9BACL|nr:extracellular solute-binding protein [Paenibacillus mendelii]MCQ6560630.1 extracellular solute-binding protein [Paenibacillus mendelii]